MADININEYVRTDNGEIHKVEDIEDLRIHIKTEKIMFRSWVDDYYGSHKEDRFIVKHSPNIIDLIEVGDYVNGREVKHIAMFEGFPDYPKLIFTDERHLIPGETAENKDIKSIVTREQFSNIEYRLEN